MRKSAFSRSVLQVGLTHKISASQLPIFQTKHYESQEKNNNELP